MIYVVILAIVRLCLQVEEFGEPILLALVLLLAVGLGAPSFSIPRLADWWWALVGILLWGNRSWRLS